MSEVMLEKAKAVALTTARLEHLFQEMKKDEAILKKVLEMKRLKRRLRAAKPMQN